MRIASVRIAHRDGAAAAVGVVAAAAADMVKVRAKQHQIRPSLKIIRRRKQGQQT